MIECSRRSHDMEQSRQTWHQGMWSINSRVSPIGKPIRKELGGFHLDNESDGHVTGHMIR